MGLLVQLASFVFVLDFSDEGIRLISIYLYSIIEDRIQINLL